MVRGQLARMSSGAGIGRAILAQVVRWAGSTAMQLQCWWLGQVEQSQLDLEDPAVAADFFILARKELLVRHTPSQLNLAKQ